MVSDERVLSISTPVSMVIDRAVVVRPRARARVWKICIVVDFKMQSTSENRKAREYSPKGLGVLGLDMDLDTSYTSRCAMRIELLPRNLQSSLPDFSDLMMMSPL